MLARGPGIVPGSVWREPATQVDIAATFLGLAGLDKPSELDGKSIAPLIMPVAAENIEAAVRDGLIPAATARHIVAQAGAKVSWRQSAFIEYYYNEANTKCVGNCSPPAGAGNGYPYKDTWCGDLTPGANNHCWALYGCDTECYPTESIQNNFIVLRSMPGSEFGDTMYAEFQTGNQNSKNIDFSNPDFYEFYNVTVDPWMMHNQYNNTPAATLQKHHTALIEFAHCAGDACP